MAKPLRGTALGKKQLESVRCWFRTIDWAAWWEEWSLAVDEKNQYVYTTPEQFIRKKGKTGIQRDFMRWYLGPVDLNDPRNNTYASAAPQAQAWLEKRSSGGWFHEKSRKALQIEISRKMYAVDALRETGTRYAVHHLARADAYGQQVDEFFRGQLTVPGQTLESNIYRASKCMELQERVLAYYERALAVFAKSFCVNFEDMAGLMKIMEATATVAAQQAIDGKPANPMQNAVLKFAEAAMAKASRYENVAALMPPDVVDIVGEAVAENVEAEAAKKKVQ